MRIYIQHTLHHGKTPNLRPPRTFSEKIQRRKIADRRPLLPLRADKVLVKDFVAQTLGRKWVIPTIWTGRVLPQELREWPLPFVMKANNASGRNAFVFREPQLVDLPAIARQWELASTHGKESGEWLYEEIAFQLLVEPFVGDGEKPPLDYKFFVFHGEPKFIQVDVDRGVNHRRCFFDPDWSKQSFSLLYPMATEDLARPATLSAMLDGCRKLAKGLDFVRLDFYEIEGRPRFGEMTFYPGSGIERFSPESADRLLGDLW